MHPCIAVANRQDFQVPVRGLHGPAPSATGLDKGRHEGPNHNNPGGRLRCGRAHPGGDTGSRTLLVGKRARRGNRLGTGAESARSRNAAEKGFDQQACDPTCSSRRRERLFASNTTVVFGRWPGVAGHSHGCLQLNNITQGAITLYEVVGVFRTVPPNHRRCWGSLRNELRHRLAGPIPLCPHTSPAYGVDLISVAQSKRIL